jgi:hypothetical protein
MNKKNEDINEIMDDLARMLTQNARDYGDDAGRPQRAPEILDRPRPGKKMPMRRTRSACCARHYRPRRRAAEQYDELAPLHAHS